MLLTNSATPSPPGARGARSSRLRTPEGALSPEVFNPAPRGPAPVALLSSTTLARRHALPPPDPPTLFTLALRAALPQGARPRYGVVASGEPPARLPAGGLARAG